MYFLGTLTFADSLPAAAPVPVSTLRELQQERVVVGCWRRTDDRGFYLLVEAGDEHEVRRDMARAPGVADGSVAFSAKAVEPL